MEDKSGSDPTDDNSEFDTDEELPLPEGSKKKWIFFWGGILFVALIIIALVSPIHNILPGYPFGPVTQLTATVVPGDNLFYIQETLPGTVTIDGQRITNIMNSEVQPPIDANQYHPIRLSAGTHHVVWQTPPFMPITCLIFVPSLASSQPCPYESPVSLLSGLNAWLISFTPSFSDVSAAQQKTLEQAMQRTLAMPPFSAIVQPGEHYLYANASGTTQIATAEVTLKATLHLHLDTDPSSPHSCVNGYGDICTNNGQNCLQLCILDYSGSSWYVAALYYPTWTYTTETSQVVAQNQLDTNSPLVGVDHSAIFQVIWARNGWQVTNLTALSQTSQQLSFLQEIGAGLTSNPSCASFTGLIRSTTTYGSTSGPDKVSVN